MHGQGPFVFRFSSMFGNEVSEPEIDLEAFDYNSQTCAQLVTYLLLPL